MPGVLPVPHADQVTVRPGLPGVLRGGLPVHLEHRAARPADHAPQQRDVVDLAGRRGRLVRLIDALQAGGDHPLAGADDPRGGADVIGWHAADLRDALGRVVRRRLLELVKADGVRIDEAAIDPSVVDELMLDAVQQCHVRPAADRQVDVRLGRHLGPARIDHHEPGPVGAI